jgi:hypothetical protein
VPGAVTGLLVYQPVAALAYLEFARAGRLSPIVLAAGSLLLGAAYHAVPLGDFGTRWLARRTADGPGDTSCALGLEPEVDPVCGMPVTPTGAGIPRNGQVRRRGGGTR